MNLYFLVEGKRTERKIYPKWLSVLLPMFTQVQGFDQVVTRNYYLMSGEGYPSILNHLKNSILDLNRVDLYSHLVVCVDADELSVEERRLEIEAVVEETPLHNATLKLIVQNRTIETWFLGNRRVLTRNPQSETLKNFIQFYDLNLNDPELMGVYDGFRNHAHFHENYLKEIFREKNISYTKKNPGAVGEVGYLNELQKRIRDEAGHLNTFQTFVTFCDHIAACNQ